MKCFFLFFFDHTAGLSQVGLDDLALQKKCFEGAHSKVETPFWYFGSLQIVTKGLTNF